jgi:hypothetical protein
MIDGATIADRVWMDWTQNNGRDVASVRPLRNTTGVPR